MGKSFVQRTAEDLARLEARTNNSSSTPRLSHASLEDTDLPMYDREGQYKGSAGKQPDGSFGVVVRNSPAQPVLTAPILPTPEAGERVANNFPVTWDGNVVSGVVPEVHGRTDVWYQIVPAEGVIDPGAWMLGGSIRDRLGGATTIVVPSTGVVAVAFQMVGADRTTKGEFSEPSYVTVTARVDATDIEDRLNAFADGELADGAYENLLVRLGEFMQIRADHIDVNSLAADTAFIGLLEAAGIVLADEVGGRRTEVSGQGLQVFDTATNTPLIQLGNFTSGDLLSLYDTETGAPTITLTGAGGISAIHLTSDQDMSVAGKPLLGDLHDSPQFMAANSVMDSVGHGAPRVFVRGFSGVSGPSPRGIAHIESKMVPGRSYRISVPDFQMGDNNDYYMMAYYTTSANSWQRPATPTSSSPSLGRVPGRYPPSDAGWATTSLSFEKIYTPTTAQWIRVLFVVGRFSGGPVQFGSSNSIATNPRFLIEDLGPRVGDGGVRTWRDPSSTTGFAEASDLVSQPYPVFRTATYTLNTTTGVATRQGTNVEPRFGFWPNGIYYLTLVQFNQWSQTGEPYSLDINVTPSRWATASGQVIQSGAVAITDTPPVSFDYETERVALPNLTGVGAGSTRLLWLSPEVSAGQTGQFRASVLIGGTGWFGPSQNNAAAGVLRRDQTFARLHTTTALQDGQVTSDG